MNVIHQLVERLHTELRTLVEVEFVLKLKIEF